MSSSAAAAVISFERMSLCSRRAPTDRCRTHVTSGSLRVTWSAIRDCAKHLTRARAFCRARRSDACSSWQPLAAPCERVLSETRRARSGDLLTEHAAAATAALARPRSCVHGTDLRSPVRMLSRSSSLCFFSERGEVCAASLETSPPQSCFLVGGASIPSSIFGTGGGAGGGSDCSEHSDMLLCATPGILPGVALDAPFAPSLTRVQNLPEMRGGSETVSHLIPNVSRMRVALPLACVRAALAAVCS